MNRWIYRRKKWQAAKVNCYALSVSHNIREWWPRVHSQVLSVLHVYLSPKKKKPGKELKTSDSRVKCDFTLLPRNADVTDRLQTVFNRYINTPWTKQIVVQYTSLFLILHIVPCHKQTYVHYSWPQIYKNNLTLIINDSSIKWLSKFISFMSTAILK